MSSNHVTVIWGAIAALLASVGSWVQIVGPEHTPYWVGPALLISALLCALIAIWTTVHGMGWHDRLRKVSKWRLRLERVDASKDDIPCCRFDRSVHVGHISTNWDNLEDGGRIRIRFHCYNGRLKILIYAGMNGFVSVSLDGSEQIRLPEPILINTNREFPQEFLIDLEQKLPPFIKDMIDLGAVDSLDFMFSEINILVSEKDKPDDTIRLPVWNRFKVRLKRDVFIDDPLQKARRLNFRFRTPRVWCARFRER